MSWLFGFHVFGGVPPSHLTYMGVSCASLGLTLKASDRSD